MVKEQLIDLINQGLSKGDMAAKLGMTYSKVYRHLIKYDLISVKKREICEEGKKFCIQCKLVKPIEEFSRRSKLKTFKLNSECRKCRAASSSERVKRFKRQCVEYKGGKCERCGYARCLAALEFHHRDPSQKEIEISSNKMGRIIRKVELDKCDLLCANCHREVHEELVRSGETVISPAS